ncbi:MAG: hypothetical protein ACT4QE_09675 [Anaerolineales bacterium]
MRNRVPWLMSALLLAAALLAAWVWWPRLAAVQPLMRSPEYGMQVFLWWTADNKTGDNDIRLVRDAGFGWIKQRIAWSDVEGSARGAWDWSRADRVVALAEHYQIKMLVRLDSTPHWAKVDPSIIATDGPPADFADYANYCGMMAARYTGRVAAYEVWNEPNLAREWGNAPPDPKAYVALLKVCYQAIKAADPQAIVISAGMAPTDEADPAVAMPDREFYQQMYDADAATYFDMLGAHAPGYNHPPEHSPEAVEADPAWGSSVWVFRHVERVRAIMERNGDGRKQIAITEMGYTSDARPAAQSAYSWYAISEEERAEYLPRMYQYAKQNWSPWIGLMVTIYIADPAWTEGDEQYWWALTRPVFPGDPPVTLPAYEALKKMEK